MTLFWKEDGKKHKTIDYGIFFAEYTKARQKGDGDTLGHLITENCVTCDFCATTVEAKDALIEGSVDLACPKCGEFWCRSLKKDDPLQKNMVKSIKIKYIYKGSKIFQTEDEKEILLRKLFKEWVSEAMSRLDFDLEPNWCLKCIPSTEISKMDLNVRLILTTNGAKAIPKIRAVFKTVLIECSEQFLKQHGATEKSWWSKIFSK